MMSKRFTFLIVLITCQFVSARSQPDIRERVYLHVNSRQLIIGETLYFSTYCSSATTGAPSQMSKILYVELIGENGVIDQQKIALKDGLAHGEFFISSLISTGTYYLLAYTRWMKNFDDYAHHKITLINPYEAYENTPKDRDELTIDFGTREDGIVTGLKNKVAFHVKSQNPQKIKGRIMDDSGEKVVDFIPDNFGLGQFELTPQMDKSYQAILETPDGNIHFFELPKIKQQGSVIYVNEQADHLEITCKSSHLADIPLTLTIENQGATHYSIKCKEGSANLIPKSLISDKLIQIKYRTNEGKLLAELPYMTTFNSIRKVASKPTYQSRQNVALPITLEAGRYSVSIRKNPDNTAHALHDDISNRIIYAPVEPGTYLSSANPNLSALLLMSILKADKPNPKSVALLPEVRHELMSGTVVNNKSEPIDGELIALSFPSDPYQINVVKSDSNGRFVIPFESTRTDMIAYANAMSMNDYSIELDAPFLTHYPDFDFSTPELDSTEIAEIVQRSIRNQIENAYFEAPQRPLTTNQWLSTFPFDDHYVLDDYKRFKTLKETFTEYILTANIRDNREAPIKTIYSPPFGSEKNPLILLDGVPVSGASLRDVSPYKIESISVLVNRFFLGALVVDGVIAFQSKEGALSGLDLSESHQKMEVIALSQSETPTYPDYDLGAEDRRPDQRDQLLWLPELIVHESGKVNINFSTSNVVGDFEVVVEGFTNEGRPVSITQTIVVTAAPN